MADRIYPTRVEVAVCPETVAALKNIVAGEGISLTEVVRRLVGYGELVDEVFHTPGAEAGAFSRALCGLRRHIIMNTFIGSAADIFTIITTTRTIE